MWEGVSHHAARPPSMCTPWVRWLIYNHPAYIYGCLIASACLSLFLSTCSETRRDGLDWATKKQVSWLSHTLLTIIESFLFLPLLLLHPRPTPVCSVMPARVHLRSISMRELPPFSPPTYIYIYYILFFFFLSRSFSITPRVLAAHPRPLIL